MSQLTHLLTQVALKKTKTKEKKKKENENQINKFALRIYNVTFTQKNIRPRVTKFLLPPPRSSPTKVMITGNLQI
jgi:glucose-6-phosphate-specific signal transduction histidine kinase